MISNLLVANRGEIALRIFRSCRDAGIGTVAVHSDADARAPHALAADAAIRLPGDSPSDTYLRAGLLVRAALDAGADAVHPGYGFLAENAGFARAVLDAGLTWVGPSPEAIETMGSKVESKRLMAEAGVPVLAELDPERVTEADLPVLVKASAGGGGRGMRIVRDLGGLAEAVESARAEAASAFGDPTVFCERYLETGRHIEVQVLADGHGAVWAVGERECSIQRRHQKVVEEAPSPLVDEPMRERLFDAARKAAKAIDYVGAGTVEFLARDDGEFFFLEMNTRLQVEHPVTECTTGLDLVDWQVRIAEGERLPDEPPQRGGHAIEVRLYAEDPAQDWQPQSGPVHRFAVPGVTAEFAVRPGVASGLRLDSGVADGSVVGVHYDPMLAKVIAWAPTRAAAARSLAGALARAHIHGLVTNRDLLVNVLRHPAFLAGETDTAFFDRHGLGTLATPLADERAVRLSALAAALADAAENRRAARVLGGLPSGWRNVVSAPQRKAYVVAGERHEIAYRLGRDGLHAEGFDDVVLVEATPERVVLEVGGVRRTFDVGRYPGLVAVDSPLGPVSLEPEPRFTDPESEVAAGSLLAPMPGTVVRVAVEQGAAVRAGEPLLWLEAMKMEHRIVAPADGVVTDLPVTVGQQVEHGAVLAVVQGEGE
ncbi:acetyl/propionyl/methylcrotonyl-CoA carboxylase subunit alpha [Prauserella muralis]|uniref:Acetyl/propionyl-CoA carboxylase subuit alpha n=1 Tax=Prauserella muralis TaxID=588067 RepID=A0A2V4AU65_9PSEU|nr:biotin carboxylase N-terminal domain-containing protein [Prauserella muralis]PXY19087.1 acetyl/propionyl-CoA carboxylase subuit alpha [Prauserella muralis]TWE28987.1 propionyl-CoA carboxylase alpha chain [Prauserella muralis]